MKEVKKEIKVFWAMRFLAFLLIFFHHTPDLNSFIRIPTLAVSFFIIISGFLNGMIYNDRFNTIRIKEILSFVKKKMKTVYQIHLMMFLLTIPLTGVFNYNKFNQFYYWCKRAICNLSLTQSWINNKEYYFGFNGVSWFLSTFLFLLTITIPAIVVLNKIKKKKNSKSIIIFISVLLFIISIIYDYVIKRNNLNLEYYLYVLPISRVPEYLIGLNFGILSNMISISSKDNKNIMWTIIELVAVIPIVLFIIIKPVHLSILNNLLDIKNNWWIIPIVLILMIYKNEKGLISKIISNRLFVYFGKISMILFLIHQPLINYVYKAGINQNSMIIKYSSFLYLLVICIVLSAIIDKLLTYRNKDYNMGGKI